MGLCINFAEKNVHDVSGLPAWAESFIGRVSTRRWNFAVAD
jgi:hypothetical protein